MRKTTPVRYSRLHSWLLAAATLALMAPAGAQTWHTVGTGTSANSGSNFPSPFADYYAGGREQYVYLASDLTAAGLSAGDQIVSLRWVVVALNGCDFLDNYTIRIGNTDATVLGGGFQPAPTGGSTVSTDYVPVLGNNDFPLKAPFTWDGTSNLLVEVTHFSTAFGEYSANASVQITSTGPDARAYILADDWMFKADQTGPLTPQNGATLAATVRPNIVLGVGDQCPALAATGYDLAVNTAVPQGEGLEANACANSYGGHFTQVTNFAGSGIPFTYSGGDLTYRGTVTIPALPAGAQMTAA